MTYKRGQLGLNYGAAAVGTVCSQQEDSEGWEFSRRSSFLTQSRSRLRASAVCPVRARAKLWLSLSFQSWYLRSFLFIYFFVNSRWVVLGSFTEVKLFFFVHSVTLL